MERGSPIPPGQILGEGLMLEWRQNIEQRDIKKERGSPIAPPPGQILWKGWNGDKILSRGTKIRVGRENPKPPLVKF